MLVPRYCSRQFLRKEGDYNSNTPSTLLYKLFFSSIVFAWGAFQARPKELMSWCPQEQLTGHKATPGRRTVGRFFA